MDNPISVAFDLQTLRGSDGALERSNAQIHATLQDVVNAVRNLEKQRESQFDINQLMGVLDTYLEAWRQLDELGEREPARAIEEAKSILRRSQFLFRRALTSALTVLPDRWAVDPKPDLELE